MGARAQLSLRLAQGANGTSAMHGRITFQNLPRTNGMRCPHPSSPTWNRCVSAGCEEHTVAARLSPQEAYDALLGILAI
jgi:hypothetical protein